MPIAVDDVLLPPEIEVESIGRVLTDTAIDTSEGGAEQREPWLLAGREGFDLKFGRLHAAFLRNLFRTQLGPLRPFLIDHLDDDVVTNVVLAKVTSGGVTKSRLRQAYETRKTSDDTLIRTSYIPIYRYATGALTITVDDVVTVPASVVDGVVSFGSVIGGTVRATITKFYKIVRFADDEFTTTWHCDDIRTVESCRLIGVLYPSLIVPD